MFDRYERVVVTGGRFYKDRETVYRVLDRLNPSVLIHGNCPIGADKLANDWAKENNVPVIGYTANWALYGAAAGPIRNRTMLRDSHPDLVVGFPGKRGTANCLATARDMGLKVLEIPC